MYPFSLFEKTAFDLGYSGLTVALYERRADQFAADLRFRIGLTAKYLARELTIPRARAYEAIARAGRFTNWHALNAHLGRVAPPAETEEDVTAPPGWFDSLVPLMALQAGVEEEVPPSDKVREVLEEFGRSLAATSDTEEATALDVVARLYGDLAWSALTGREAMNAVSPLYSFAISSYDGSGSFDWSPACHVIVKRLDAEWQGYSRFSAAKKRHARRYIEETVRRRPDFLEAGLALSWILYKEHERNALPYIERYIEKAEQLLPQHFEGVISWYSLENRFYHRMLYLQMRLYFHRGDTKTAARISRKMLRLNPSDNLGIRIYLPLICLSGGDVRGARNALKRLNSDGMFDQEVAAVRAFVRFADGDLKGFRRDFLKGLFTLPVLRSFCENSPTPLRDRDDGYRGVPHDMQTIWVYGSPAYAKTPGLMDGYRGVQPDMETFWEFGSPAYAKTPGLMDAVMNLLSEQSIRDAEAELKRMWTKGFHDEKDQNDRSATLRQWSERTEEYVAAL